MMILADPAAERGILSGICKYGNESFLDVDDLITPSSFSQEINAIIYECIKNVYSKESDDVKIDAPTILNSARELGYDRFFEHKSEVEHLRAIFAMRIEPQTVRRFAAQVRKLEIGRLLSEQLDAAKTDLNAITGTEPISHILGLAENRIFDFSSLISEENQHGPEQIAKGIDEWVQNIIENPRELVGISTGFPRFDKSIGGGLRRKTVNLIGARLKVGKTILADKFCSHISGSLNIPVLNIDSEMDRHQHWSRLLASPTEIPMEEIETGKFAQSKAKRKKIDDAVIHLKSIPYSYICVAGMAFEEILSNIRRWLYKDVGKENGNTKDCVVVYDYIKLMTATGISNSMAEYQLLGFQMSALTNFAIKYDIPILAFTQLNRSGINEESTAAVSQSDRLAWFAANFSIFKKKEKEEIEHDDPINGQTYGNRKLIPIVCRHGGGLEDGDYINVKLTGNIAKVEEGLLRSEVQKADSFEITDNDESLEL